MFRCQYVQRFPAFGTSHAKVNGIFGIRRKIDRPSVAQMNVQTTARRTITTHHRRRCIRLCFCRHLSEPKFARRKQQIAREHSFTLIEGTLIEDGRNLEAIEFIDQAFPSPLVRCCNDNEFFRQTPVPLISIFFVTTMPACQASSARPPR